MSANSRELLRTTRSRASFFTDVRVIAVVGEDFGPEQEAVLRGARYRHPGHRTRTRQKLLLGRLLPRQSQRGQNSNTELNVFATFAPKIPDAYRDSEYLFLANIDPVLQHRVREAMPDVKLVAGDTMNFWIKDHRGALLEVLKGLDVLLINDTEARMLAGNNNLLQAARGVLELGPQTLIIKHGEYGATAFFSRTSFKPHREGVAHTPFRAPALPLEEVVDPTGAGDSFAGGFFGYLASQSELTPSVFRRAMFYGSVLGSYACERFGTERLQQLSREEIDERFQLFRELTHLD